MFITGILFTLGVVATIAVIRVGLAILDGWGSTKIEPSEYRKQVLRDQEVKAAKVERRMNTITIAICVFIFVAAFISSR